MNNLDDRILQTWARYFDLPVELFNRSGTTLKPNEQFDENSFILLWSVGSRTVIELALTQASAVAQLVAQHPQDYQLTSADFEQAWGAIDTLTNKMYTLSPQWFFPFRPEEPFIVRQLSPADQPAFDLFAAQCSEAEKEEGDVSIDHLVAYGAFAGEHLAAVASTYEWRKFIDIGVLTAPAYRGQGLGKAVVSACCEHYLLGEQVVVYRHDANNEGSRRIAESLHFKPYTALEGVRRR